jgi:preprotein translocase subunit SecE
MARTTEKKGDNGAASGGGDKPAKKFNPGVKGTVQPKPEAEGSATERAQDWWTEFQKYLKSVQAETKRVSWPSKEELRAYTMVVLVTLIVVTVFLFLCDLLFTHLFGALISMLHHGAAAGH